MDFKDKDYILICGNSLDKLKELSDESINCCVTSPPYFQLRDYGMDEQIGNEETPELFIDKLVEVFHEVKRVLKKDGTLWVNMGDCYCSNNGFNRSPEKYLREGRYDAKCYGRNLNELHDNGYKTKDLIGIPWMLAFALRKDGWYLRQDIIWLKGNPMPQSVTDRCTKAHEYIFLLSKSPKYFFDHEAIEEPANYDGRKDTMMHGSEKYSNSLFGQKEQTMASKGHERWKFKTGIKFGGNKYGDNDDKHYATKSGNEYNIRTKTNENNEEVYAVRNKRDVWNVPTESFSGSHFATFPKKLIEPCILAGCPEGGIVLDPFNGAGTTGIVSIKNGRKYVGIELNPEYVELTEKRFNQDKDYLQKNIF